VHKWLETKTNLKPTTRRDYESLLQAHIVPRWGSMTLAEVKPADITSWLADLSACGLSAWRVRAAHVQTGCSLRATARNPAEYVPLPRVRRADKRYLTHDEVEALADAAGKSRPVILFLAYTGVRFGEMAALRLGQLDLLRRPATISEAVAEVGGRIVFSTPKTHQSRTVPIPRFLVDELAALVVGKGSQDLVFTGVKGAMLRLSHFLRAVFIPAVEATGPTVLTPHGLRHTAASLAIASGADVKVVQTMLGHASATMTLDLYGHIYADRLDEIADRMDAARTARTVKSRTSVQDHANFCGLAAS
jgi:integrase